MVSSIFWTIKIPKEETGHSMRMGRNQGELVSHSLSNYLLLMYNVASSILGIHVAAVN